MTEETFFGVFPLIATSTVGGPRDFARAVSGIKKTNDVREIVSQLEIADAIFGGREETTGNTSAVRRLLRF